MEQLKNRKVVYLEADRIKSIRGDVTVRDDEFIIIHTATGNVWIGKGAVKTIKNNVSDRNGWNRNEEI